MKMFAGALRAEAGRSGTYLDISPAMVMFKRLGAKVFVQVNFAAGDLDT
jgi:hypothetical protein